VLDPFCGSGSTGEAAIKLGRHFVGIELYGDYAQIAEERCRLVYLLRSEYEAENPPILPPNRLLLPADNPVSDDVSFCSDSDNPRAQSQAAG